jgi:hypothetical protein
MTVVAALKIEGVPALIGDFLITDEHHGSQHEWLPTRPNLNDPRHPQLPRRVSEVRRKIHLINERFILAFTGDVDAGGVIFAYLQKRFGNTNKGPSIQSISSALQQFNIPFRSPKRATVIGWTCGSRPRCFRWEAKLGASAAHVSYAIEGSGRDHFTSILTNVHRSEYGFEVKTGFEKSVLLGIAKIGAVLTEELSTAVNLQASYGYGAELALYNGNRFEFLPKIGYYFWNARIDQQGMISIMPAMVSVIYETRQRYCLLQVTHFSLQSNGVMKAENTYCWAIAPLHDELLGLIFTRENAPTWECPYYFNGIVVADTRSNRIGRVHFAGFGAHDAPFRFRKTDNLHWIEWDRNLLEKMILAMPIDAAAPQSTAPSYTLQLRAFHNAGSAPRFSRSDVTRHKKRGTDVL